MTESGRGRDFAAHSAQRTGVTGLAPLDTATLLSDFGQVILLARIQVGGLGVMTLSSFVAIVLGRRLGLARPRGPLDDARE